MKFPTALKSALLLAFVYAPGVYAQDAEQDENDAAAAETEIENIIVTGSRIQSAKPTAQVVTIDAEEIARRGLATGADIIRSIPQNFANVNIGSSTLDSGRLGGSAQGTATANLRGLGEGATLVLVNGRRVAGSATYDSGTVNLSTIPSAAIDRVEILLDGASAIYGADGIAGVINFILKDDYQGATSKVRFEDNGNGGGALALSQTFGHNWSSGNVMLALDYRETEAVDTRKAGYTTQDLTAQGGTDWRFSGDFTPRAPGTIAFWGALPPSFDGTEAWTAADLIPVAQLEPLDSAARSRSGTPETESLAVTLSFRQALGDKVSVFSDLLYSKNDNESVLGDVQGGFISVPATNPFNQLGQPVFVSYVIEDLDLVRSTDIERTNFTLGADFELPWKNWQLTVSGTVGEETTDTDDVTYDFTAAAATENFFGNGSAFDPAPFLVQNTGDAPGRETEVYEASANGSLGSLAGGDIGLAIGLHSRSETLDYSKSPGSLFINNPIDDKLELENEAYFFELNFPLVGPNNARTGIQELIVNLAGRQEEYDFSGQFGGAGSPNETKTFDHFSPRIGASWAINDAFRMRASWGESFKAPALISLGSQVQYFSFFTLPIIDPISGQPFDVMFGFGGNPNLEPEVAETTSIGFEITPGSVEGLMFSATYTDIDWSDKIANVAAGDPNVAAIPELLVQVLHYDVPVSLGGDGDPTTPDAWPNQPLNLADRKMRSIDADLSYRFDSNVGEFNLGATAVYSWDVFDVLLPGSPEIPRDETDEGPDRLVMQGRVEWVRDALAANLYVNYSSSYDNMYTRLLPQPHKVDSYTTVDLTGSYTWDNGFVLNAGIFNITDESFPFFDASSANFDTRRVDTRGRWFFLELSKEFEF